jgi:hypothetical protein
MLGAAILAAAAPALALASIPGYSQDQNTGTRPDPAIEPILNSPVRPSP